MKKTDLKYIKFAKTSDLKEIVILEKIKTENMKKILVPTDFSSASIKALDYASKISAIDKSEIMVLWVDNYDATSNLDLDIQVQTAVRQEAKEELNEMIENASKLHPTVKYKQKIKTGKVFREVGALATTEHSTLVVISTHGGSGFEDFWIGSNAYRIISAAPCPVISLKQSINFGEKIVNRILVPIDHTPETLNKLPIIIEFATKFNAEIALLAIFTTSLTTLNKKVEHAATTAINHIKEAGLTFSFDEMNTENIVTDLLKFVDKSAIDLVAITTEQGGKEDLSGMGQIAQQVINRCPVPVLSVR